MLRKHLCWLISGLLLIGSTAQLAAAGQKREKEATTVEKVKTQIAKLGLGEKAKATIIARDGTKTRGYVARAGEDDFVMRDAKTDNATTVRYADVAQVDAHKGHSTARAVGISAAVGAGALVGLVLILFAGRG